MNKLLTTIILLCFSISANADIWFCQATHLAGANSRRAPGIIAGEANANLGFVIDTEKGLRAISSPDYFGSCTQYIGRENVPKIYCESKHEREKSPSEQLFIDVQRGVYTYFDLQTSGGFGVGMHTQIGTCTKA